MSKPFLFGLAFGVLLSACAGLGFHYRHYGMELVSYEEGKLLGPKPEQDLPVSVCKPDETSKGKCVVMLSAEFFRLKSDYLEIQQQLVDCQRGLAP